MGKKTGRQCTCCQHRERVALDTAIARGVSVTALARKYGLSTDAIYRHSKSHLPPTVRARLIAGPDAAAVDIERLRADEADSVLLHLVNLRNRLFAALDTAEEFGDPAMLNSTAAQLHKNFELVAKLVGSLATGTHVTNNILITPVWVETRGALMDALRTFPDAKRAVAKALAAVESKAADAIRNESREFAGAMPKTPLTIEHDPQPAPAPPRVIPPPPC